MYEKDFLVLKIPRKEEEKEKNYPQFTPKESVLLTKSKNF